MKSLSRKPYHTITEAAKELGITRAAVHRAIKQGRLEAERGEIIKLVRTKTKGWKISQPSINSYRVSLCPSVGRGKNSVTVDNSYQP